MAGIDGAVPPGAAPHSSATTKLWRGLTRRCPRCGERDLFESWFTLRARCPSCTLRLDRGETDFWIGAWMLNVVGVEITFVTLLAVAVILMWPAVPWNAILWTGVAGMALLPVLFFPISRTLWLAVDMILQPERPSDFDDRAE